MPATKFLFDMPYWPRYLPPAADRFEAKIVRVPEAGCWIWMGAVDPNGYGRFRATDKTVLAHRFSYEQRYGPIPDGMYLCHACDVPPCCNPGHLFVGTQKDNMADWVAKGLSHAGEKNYRAVLNDIAVREIRAANGPHKEIAVRYGIHQMTVGKIKRGIRWGHVK